MFSQDAGLQGRQIGGKGNSVSRKKTIAKTYSSPMFLHSGTKNWYSIFTCGTWRFSAKSFSSHTVLISVCTLELPRKIQEPYSGILILLGQSSDVDLLFVSQ